MAYRGIPLALPLLYAEMVLGYTPITIIRDLVELLYSVY